MPQHLLNTILPCFNETVGRYCSESTVSFYCFIDFHVPHFKALLNYCATHMSSKSNTTRHCIFQSYSLFISCLLSIFRYSAIPSSFPPFLFISSFPPFLVYILLSSFIRLVLLFALASFKTNELSAKLLIGFMHFSTSAFCS